MLAPGGQREHLHALDEPDHEPKRARARADDDRCAQRDRLRQSGEQDLLHLQAAAEMARRRAVLRGEPAEVDDAPDAGPLRRGDEVLCGGAFVGLEAGARIALHRVDEEVGDVDAVERLVEAGAGDRVALDEAQGGGNACGVAAEAAQLVAVGGSAGSSDAPTAPLAPVSRIRMRGPSSPIGGRIKRRASSWRGDSLSRRAHPPGRRRATRARARTWRPGTGRCGRGWRAAWWRAGSRRRGAIAGDGLGADAGEGGDEVVGAIPGT